MGKKAKLKKVRKEIDLSGTNEVNNHAEPQHFVKQLERQGYSLKRIQRAPDVPENRIDPQV
jgi:hypothetical protein